MGEAEDIGWVQFVRTLDVSTKGSLQVANYTTHEVVEEDVEGNKDLLKTIVWL